MPYDVVGVLQARAGLENISTLSREAKLREWFPNSDLHGQCNF